ncbi:MAG: glycine--tRNA ligase subunit alpha [Leptospirales bacterium]|nr:glycine--tRNA ligase subunit alpha [Leptospirales bacterium]
MYFQTIISKLHEYWSNQGCIILQGYDQEVGAGTFNPATFLKALGPEPWNTAYVEPSKRPADGRYGENPNRLQQHYQYQVIMKPSPVNIQDLYLKSLEYLGINLKEHDLRFVEDDWESPTLGASGLGWEVWLDGMEVTQFTYFQQCGSIDLDPISVELTYGLERMCTYITGIDSVYDISWNEQLTYRDIHHRSEFEYSHYNFNIADTNMYFKLFDMYEKECLSILEHEECKIVLPAYDFVLKCSHTFNMLDARGAISVTERTGYITRVRNIARKCAERYVEIRKDMGYPLLKYKEEQKV